MSRRRPGWTRRDDGTHVYEDADGKVVGTVRKGFFMGKPLWFTTRKTGPTETSATWPRLKDAKDDVEREARR